MAVVINGIVYENLVQLAAQKDALNLSYWKGDTRIVSVVVPEEVTAIAGDFTIWPNVTEVIVLNHDSVVTGLDTKFANTSGITYWVADDMLTAYETAYPTLAFNTWPNYDMWTIPYIEGETSTTLTAEYVQSELAKNPLAISATKVVVPSYFTNYEENCFSPLVNMVGIDTLDTDTPPTSFVENPSNYYSGFNTADGHVKTLVLRNRGISNVGGSLGYIDTLKFYGDVSISPMQTERVSHIKTIDALDANVTGLNFYRGAFPKTLLANCPNMGELRWTAFELWGNVSPTRFVLRGYKQNMNGSFGNDPAYLTYIRLTRDGWAEFIDELGIPDTKKTIKIGSANLAQLTNADIQAAYDKNYALDPTPVAFSVEIGSNTYSCDFGMTWATWVASAYNTAGFTISNNKVYDANSQAVQKDGADVADTDMVRYGDTYTLA